MAPCRAALWDEEREGLGGGGGGGAARLRRARMPRTLPFSGVSFWEAIIWCTHTVLHSYRGCSCWCQQGGQRAWRENHRRVPFAQTQRNATHTRPRAIAPRPVLAPTATHTHLPRLLNTARTDHDAVPRGLMTRALSASWWKICRGSAVSVEVVEGDGAARSPSPSSSTCIVAKWTWGGHKPAWALKNSHRKTPIAS